MEVHSKLSNEHLISELPPVTNQLAEVEHDIQGGSSSRQGCTFQLVNETYADDTVIMGTESTDNLICNTQTDGSNNCTDVPSAWSADPHAGQQKRANYNSVAMTRNCCASSCQNRLDDLGVVDLLAKGSN